MNDPRLEAAKRWLSAQPSLPDYHITPLAGDASFRRYFRITAPQNSDTTYVLMDAPPDKEDVTPFLQVCHWLSLAHLNTPRILIQDQQQGFLLLQDFGDTTWAVFMQSSQNMMPLFQDALQQLHVLQAAPCNINLPLFDLARMQTEANLYLHWYLPYVQQHTPSQQEEDNFHHALLPILERINSIPKAPVHLDFHSRNLMLPAKGLPLGIIDFQDAVHGPITYDLASLLYDCYQDYNEQERIYWSQQFFNTLSSEHQAYFEHDFQQWHTMLRLTALQRHIKAIGIFARLAYRDHKHQFLDEIPLTRKHLHDELQALSLDLPLLQDISVTTHP